MQKFEEGRKSQGNFDSLQPSETIYRSDMNYQFTTKTSLLSDNTNFNMVRQIILSLYLSLMEVSLILYSDKKMNYHFNIVTTS